MEAYNSLVEPIYTFNRKFKYYGNSNNISMKLLSEMKRKTTAWVLDLKKSLSNAAKLISDRSSQTIENINKSTQDVKHMIQDIPLFKSTENSDSRGLKMQLFINEHLS